MADRLRTIHRKEENVVDCMSKSVHESEIVLIRFEDICPDKMVDSMCLKAVEDDE